MGHAVQFDATLRPKKGRYFPKKILTHRKIPINENYAFTASVWVADTPESKRKPTINLVLSHANQTSRFCFDSVSDLLAAVTVIREFILEKSFVVNDAYNDALREYLEYHESKRILSLNDNTIHTVIQDISESKYTGKRRFVNKRTGEIIEP